MLFACINNDLKPMHVICAHKITAVQVKREQNITELLNIRCDEVS